MTTELETLVARFEADTRGIRADLQKFGKQLDGIEAKARSVDRSFSKAFRSVAASIGAIIGTREIARFFTGSVQGASDVEEAVNKVSVVFGDASRSVLQFSERTADAFGIARAEALGAAADFGNILSASGLVGDAAAQMSVELVKLAGDLASFNNLSTADALQKLRAGLVGETEPLRTVGVLLSEAAVKAKAYEVGIASVGATLTEAEKVQARYAIILEHTKNAQGDAARTAGTLANMQRRLSAVWTDMRANIGDGLRPEVERLYQTMLDPAFQRFVETTIAGAVGLFADLGNSVAHAANAANDVLNKENARAQLDELFGGVEEARTRFRQLTDDVATARGILARGVLPEAEAADLRQKVIDMALEVANLRGLLEEYGDKLGDVEADTASLASATDGKLRPALDAAGESMMGLAGAADVLKGLPDIIRDAIPEDIKLEIDKAAFAADVEATKKILAEKFPDLSQKLLELDVLPENVEELEKLFRKLTKKETKVIEVETRAKDRGQSGVAGGLHVSALAQGVSQNLIDFSAGGLTPEQAIAGGFSTNLIDFSLSPQVVESPAVPLKTWLARQPDRFTDALSGMPIEFQSNADDILGRIEAIKNRISEIRGPVSGPFDTPLFGQIFGTSANARVSPMVGFDISPTTLTRESREMIAAVQREERALIHELRRLTGSANGGPILSDKLDTVATEIRELRMTVEKSGARQADATSRLADRFQTAGFISKLDRISERQTGRRLMG